MTGTGRRRGLYEPPHVKTNKVAVRPAKTQISLGIRPVWSESSLSAWRKLRSLATRWAHSEGSGQTGRMPMLIWVFAGRTLILLVLSWGGSYSGITVVLYNFYITKLFNIACIEMLLNFDTFLFDGIQQIIAAENRIH